MESKKRPNSDGSEDPPGAIAATSIAPPRQTQGDGQVAALLSDQALSESNNSLAMDISPPREGAATTITSDVVPVSEPNKRVKLTIESEKSGAAYSPSVDLVDPSQESKGLVDWVNRLDNEIKDSTEADREVLKEQTSDNQTQEGSSTDSVQGQEQLATKIESGTIPPNVEGPTTSSDPSNQGNGTSTNLQDVVSINIGDSILAVPSLSEPLLDTLRALENNVPTPTDNSPTEPESPKSTAASPVSKLIPDPVPGAQPDFVSTPLQSDSANVSFVKDGLPEITESADLDESNQRNVRESDSAKTVDVVLEKETEVNTNPIKAQASPSTSTPIPQMAAGHEFPQTEKSSTRNNQDTDPTVSPCQQKSDTVASSTAQTPKTTENTTTTDMDSTTTTTATAAKDAGSSATGSSFIQLPSLVSSENWRSDSDPSQPQHSSAEPKSLPPLSSISGSPAPQTNQPRSTMSLSALLTTNEDDSEQERLHPKGPIPRNIFESFENLSPKSPQSPPPLTPPSSALSTQQHRSAQSQTRQPQPQPQQQPLSQKPPQGTKPVQSSPSTSQQPQTANTPPTSSPASSRPYPGSGRSSGSPHRQRDAFEGPGADAHHSQAPHGYHRPLTDPHSFPTGRYQDLPPTQPRSVSSKDYSQDEVMESGGASGIAGQRGRLASPTGARPGQEPTSGPGTGTGAAGLVSANVSGPNSSVPNAKLPSLGSITGISPVHAHDSPSQFSDPHRGDFRHGPAPGRPGSLPSSQHQGLATPANANGHIQYPPGNQLAHSPNSMISHQGTPILHPGSTHPRLIVKNNTNLKLEDRPELFLGYYRYDPSLLLPTMEGKENSLLEVRIASSYLTYDNIKVKKREVWGTDVYTDDSDIVAMMIHAGYFIPPTSSISREQDSLQPKTLQHNFAPYPLKHICPGYDLAVTLRVLPRLVRYQGTIRNRIKSRTWITNHDGASLRVESIRKLAAGEALNRGRSQSKRRMKENNVERQRVLANIHDETTESLQNERAMRTATFEFTHQGDPCFKYSPELVMDRHDGLSRKWTSWRLKKEVLILENDEERYEISLQHQAGTDSRRFDQYRFAVISPRTSLSSWSNASYPLDSSKLFEVLYEDLDWQDFEWVERGVVVQPSSRSKANGFNHESRGGAESITAAMHMEGVESTDAASNPTNTLIRDKDAPTPKMDMDQVGSGTLPKLSTGVSSTLANSMHTQQQDGVFCVVSRLFWRPRTEQRSQKTESNYMESTGVTSSKTPQGASSAPLTTTVARAVPTPSPGENKVNPSTQQEQFPRASEFVEVKKDNVAKATGADSTPQKPSHRFEASAETPTTEKQSPPVLEPALEQPSSSALILTGTSPLPLPSTITSSIPAPTKGNVLVPPNVSNSMELDPSPVTIDPSLTPSASKTTAGPGSAALTAISTSVASGDKVTVAVETTSTTTSTISAAAVAVAVVSGTSESQTLGKDTIKAQDATGPSASAQTVAQESGPTQPTAPVSEPEEGELEEGEIASD